jgi:hypothetical protein
VGFCLSNRFVCFVSALIGFIPGDNMTLELRMIGVVLHKIFKDQTKQLKHEAPCHDDHYD